MIDDRQLAQMLGLPYVPQDWGVEFADPTRISEFLEFLKVEALTTGAEINLIELILNSMNDALVDGVRDSIDKNDIDFILRAMNRHSYLSQYWLDLAGNSEFPIAWLLARSR
ncbi:hypothetical protein [Acuticoccus kandeliae]|uniref:hypothetical protein n=1 Tax=Acuticoccus kandeliae TaxID=2073160 RepID=UPI001300A4EE|nr:hypothetical protein [Acuticoccus kandeliae]